jgi:protein-tyrosine-phosphatase
MSHVLFVCIQNADRSQMAHALFERAVSGHGALCGKAG